MIEDKDTVDLTIDYNFISNAITVQMQMDGYLGSHQRLRVNGIELDVEDSLLYLTATTEESTIN